MAELLKNILTCGRRSRVNDAAAVPLIKEDDGDMDDPDVYEPVKEEKKPKKKDNKENKDPGLHLNGAHTMDERLRDVPRKTDWAGDDKMAWKDGEVAMLKGDTHMLREDWPEAEEAYLTAVALQPDLLEAHLGVCNAQRKLRKFMRAFSAARSGLKFCGTDNKQLMELRDIIQAEYQADKHVVKKEGAVREKAARERVQKMCDEGAMGPKPDGLTELNWDLKDKKKQQLDACPGETKFDPEQIILKSAPNPSYEEREEWKTYVLNVYRDLYKDMPSNDEMDLNYTGATSSYDAGASSGLKISEGHKHIPRPAGVVVPDSFRKHVGFISLAKLKEYNCEKERLLVSVYGDVFDVSDRPDKYGKDGPYYYFSGSDITYGLASGQDDDTTVNKFFDIFKLEDEEQRDKRLQILCSWIGFYEKEYGMPVGRLEVYEEERNLPAPPADAENCCVM